ncbi:MAG: PqqD family peptide modification chaperone, partial [Candidatus Sumerlaeia bacterium]|nr:PqqD family peptide modification chaperone [Candidatus Sumerlaeia bacterium]
MAPALLTETPKMVEGWILDRVPDLEDHAILLHPALPKWALANSTGIQIAMYMDGTRTAEDIAGLIAAHFGIEVTGGLLDDIVMYIGQLEHAGLVESSSCQSRIKGHKPPAPPSVTVYLTEECNLRCKHCAIVEGKMPQTKLDEAAIRTIIQEHLENHPESLVSFLGGEPLLHPDCLDLLEFAISRSSHVSVCTNGLLVTDEIAQRLASMKNVRVQVSLDGADSEGNDAIRGKGSFDKAWKSLERMVALGMGGRLTVATTLTRSVVNNIRQLVARLDDLGVGTVRFLPLNKRLAAKTNWD